MTDSPTTRRYGAGIFTIPDFLSPEECANYIATSERIGYSEAAIQTPDGERLYKEARNNDRIVFDDPALAARLFERAWPLLPPEIDGWQLARLNDRLRYYRYFEGHQFDWHYDGIVRVRAGEESFLTFMVYLNDDYEGGSTDFSWEAIRPEAGMALVFPHGLRHRGAPVRAGCKYVLRSDVMYVRSLD